MKISSHITRRSVAWWSGGFGSWKLPLRGCQIRDNPPVPPCESLSLLALPQAFRDVRPDAGPGGARAVSAARRRGAPPCLRARARGRSQGLLQRLRLEPLRRQLAGRRGDLGPARLPRRRPPDSPPVPYVHRVTRILGRSARGWTAAL